MSVFNFERSAAMIRKCTTAKVNKKDEDGNRVERIATDFHLDILVDEKCSGAVEVLFPCYEDIEQQIAGYDGSHPGVKIQTRCGVPTLAVQIHDIDGGRIFKFPSASTNGSPVLSIDRLGDSTMKLRLDVMLSRKEMEKLADYVGAEVHVSAVPTQEELFSPQIAEATHEEEERYEAGAA